METTGTLARRPWTFDLDLDVSTVESSSFGLDEFVDRQRMDYNHDRPQSSLDRRAPVAFATACLEQSSGSLRLAQGNQRTCEILSGRLEQDKGSQQEQRL